ncbi:zinc finger MYM-type protein 1-like [Aphis craccivora]|uniref:Zinc finger MYM-type protein 1-like n=1 Tax=Aphis craccivora TaxID=307492 RepID=A0A6G0YTJ8_APHCR|nr:zinc finger MYM-type protein 1-like [Aphis craccivora]
MRGGLNHKTLPLAMAFFNNLVIDNNNIIINKYLDIVLIFHIRYTIPIANCSAERAFSKLARIKNKYRTNRSQENLNSFMDLCTENDVLELLPKSYKLFNPIIEIYELLLDFIYEKQQVRIFLEGNSS